MSRTLLKLPWTTADINRLKAFIGNGTSALRAAAALKRSMSSVRKQANLIGLSFPSIRPKRTEEAHRRGRSTAVLH